LHILHFKHVFLLPICKRENKDNIDNDAPNGHKNRQKNLSKKTLIINKENMYVIIIILLFKIPTFQTVLNGSISDKISAIFKEKNETINININTI